MTIIKDVSSVPPSGETIIRIYAAGQLAFSRAAADVLNLKTEDKIAFIEGRTSGGSKAVFITKRSSIAYNVYRIGNHYRIRSKSLCYALAQALDGFGSYRIEFENAEIDAKGNKFYPIFFRNLSKHAN